MLNQLKERTDDELLAASQNGDAEATEELMERYKRMVVAKANRFYLAGAQKEDLIQEGMIGLYKGIRSYDPDGAAAFSYYAEICVQRKMYHAMEAAQRQKNLPLNQYVSLDHGPENGDGGEQQAPYIERLEQVGAQSPEEIMIDRENVDRIDRFLEEALSDLEKQVLGLHLEGRGYQEIAECLGKQPKQIDNTLQRIRRKLRSRENPEQKK